VGEGVIRFQRQSFAGSLAVLLCGAGLSLGAADAERAVIPYDKLDKFWQLNSTVNQSNLVLRGLFSSKNDAVRPGDIQLTIHSKKRGDIPVELTTNGEIKAFPHTEELAKENPPVISNLPKGTLNMAIMLYIPPPDGLSFPYSKLRNGVVEFNKLIKAEAGLFSMFAPKSKEVIFFFPNTSTGKAKVEITSASGKKEYRAGAHGQLKVELDSKVADDAEVRVSEKVLGLAPAMP
jgi:hypothetical protein